MSIYVTQEDAKDKIAAIEGEHWLENQRRLGKNSFTSALKTYNKMLKEAELEEDSRSADRVKELFFHTIYGKGGFNRYFVRPDGRIEFSEFHSMPEDVKKAKELGFDMA